MKTKLFVDAAANRFEKITNAYGAKTKWTDGYKVAVLSEDKAISQTFTNRQASNSLMAEAWAVLKAVEVAVESGLTEIIIASDAISGFSHPAHDGETYLQIASRIASEAGVAVEFEHVAGTENPADALTREVTVIVPKGPASGTVDDLIAKCNAYGPAKNKVRKLATANLERAWAIWNEISSPDFRIDGKQVSGFKKNEIFLIRLAA